MSSQLGTAKTPLANQPPTSPTPPTWQVAVNTNPCPNCHDLARRSSVALLASNLAARLHACLLALAPLPTAYAVARARIARPRSPSRPAMPSSPSRDAPALPASSSPASVATTSTSSVQPAAAAAHQHHHVTDLQPPPSPRTHRALRRLQSAHALGAARSINQPSLISQQRRDLQRAASPTRDPGAVNRSPNRGRANSDATTPPIHQLAASTKRSGLKKPVFSHGHLTLPQIIRDGPNDGDFVGALESARWKVIDEGIKSAEDGMASRTLRACFADTGQSTLRIYVWLVLLDAPIMPTDEYLSLVHRGASPAYSKIRNDTFRTLTTDPLFRRRVSEASLIRLLNAIAWRLHDAKEDQRQSSRPSSRQSSHPRESLTGSVSGHSQAKSNAGPEPGTYVQGMNVLAAPFLYAARSEAEAFVAFHSLLTRECPAYIRGAMDGVHRGLALVDKVLAIVDPKLSMYLTAKGLSAEIYAFPSVLTLCACTPPLPEVLRLWDFLFAYGPHLNIVCIVAQLTIMRAQILQSPSPNKVLRSFPQLNADLVKSVTIGIIKKIPDDVYAEIVMHAL
ncbi:mitotic check point protein (Bub2) [Purpureocillium lavendulum]|uniref:Mitotic check point protein (Bub2) n=1 Tax=Purpureocillium lavendulum TaxID=1247861 RepID=A0AB34G5L1_9HYPO|nr:mitotic check point protein (Bub2) [Purpureocillium lavendulum]